MLSPAIRNVFLALLICLSAVAARADDRVKGLFVRAVTTDDKDEAAVRYGFWSNMVFRQVQDDIRNALEDLSDEEQGQYLKNFDIEIHSVQKVLSQNEFEATWQNPGILVTIQGIPQQTATKVFKLEATAFLGPKIGSINKKFKNGVSLIETMGADASRASADALVLIILYSLIENAALDNKSDQIICGLIAEARNFLRDAELDHASDSSITENTQEIVARIAARVDQHNKDRSCLHAR